METINVTLAQLAQAFEAWENGFRADPATAPADTDLNRTAHPRVFLPV